MTKNQLIELCKKENPTITSTVNGESVELTGEDYEAAVEAWVEMKLQQVAVEEAELAAASAKLSAQAKLADLGLTAEEISALSA